MQHSAAPSSLDERSDESVSVLMGPIGSLAKDTFDKTTEELFAQRQYTKIRSLLVGYKEAGSTIAVTPTFAASVRGHEPQRAFDDDLRHWNIAAMQIAKEVFPHQRIVASIAPIHRTGGEDDAKQHETDHDWFRSRHKPQILALMEGGAEEFLGEAFRYPMEIAAVADLLDEFHAKSFTACVQARHSEGKLPYVPNLRYHHLLDAMRSAVHGNMIARIGVNCAGTDDCLRVLDREPEGSIYAVYPNHEKIDGSALSAQFVALAELPHRTDAQNDTLRALRSKLQATPEELTTLTRMAIQHGAKIIGICCGGGYEEVRLLRGVVDAHQNVARREFFPSEGQIPLSAGGPVVD